jgi:hypothetical protein
VARGNFSKYLLQNTDVKTLLLVDPYKNFAIEEYTDAMNSYDQQKEFEECQKKLIDYNDRTQFIKKTSVEACNEFEDESVDFIYIDGNHAYEYVYSDLENYWKKLKKNGILAGDDYYEYSKDDIIYWDNIEDINYSKSFGKFGVKQAVIDFCKNYQLNYRQFSNQYFIVK